MSGIFSLCITYDVLIIFNGLFDDSREILTVSRYQNYLRKEITT